MCVYWVGYVSLQENCKGVSVVSHENVQTDPGKLDKKATRPTVTAKTMPAPGVSTRK